MIEKEADIGSATSASNTALIHPGYDPVSGSLKAKMNVAAVPLWPGLSAELNFNYERSGDYVVAIGPEELPKLDELFERGKRNGVNGMHFVSGEEMRRREPLMNPEVSGALFAETGSICDPFGVTLAAAGKRHHERRHAHARDSLQRFHYAGQAHRGCAHQPRRFWLPLGHQLRRSIFRLRHAHSRRAPGVQDHPRARANT